MKVKIALMLIMFIIGILELIVGTIFYMKEKKLKLSGIKTQAKVIRLDRIERRYKPTIEYKTTKGIIKRKSVTSSSKIFFPFNNEGDVVNIYYDENNVNRYRFENNIIMLTIIGIIFFSAVLSFIWVVIIYLIL